MSKLKGKGIEYAKERQDLPEERSKTKEQETMTKNASCEKEMGERTQSINAQEGNLRHMQFLQWAMQGKREG